MSSNIACSAPEKIEPGKRYPLVLFLHGAGERGDDNVEQLKYLPTWLASDENRRKYPCFVIAPQCPAEMKWSDVDWSDPKSQPLGEMSRADAGGGRHSGRRGRSTTRSIRRGSI